MWNGFRPVLNMIKKTRSQTENGNLIITMDSKDYFDNHIKELRSISDEVVLAPA
jgi:hypothetical protein